MRISSKQLTGLPVRTKSGKNLGKVHLFELDTLSGRLDTLHVKTGGIVHGLIADDLLIRWSQVVELSDQAVIVSDATVPEGARALAAGPAAGGKVSGVLSYVDSEEDSGHA
ncbi:hypothetical protein GF380_00530 [Candidatus Uhrbacteria bacterium]|nr:hypothetical protein [Candidatus Uhrbacteria bacterium]MBD3283871.1 hypothetical protein [Candidatus Uhrbacteria bacterium]